MKVSKFSFILSIVLIFQISSYTMVNSADAGDKYISSQGACVMEYETGEVLYEHNGYVKRSPASMTKVMSLYCIFKELDRQQISLDTPVPISKNVYDMPVLTNYQCIPIYENTVYTVDELIGAVATYSASNALMALVELVCKDEAQFVELMNITAGQMGIDAVYYDSCGGLTNAISPVSMATLARNIIRDYPEILERTSKKYIVFNGLRYQSTNKLFSTYYYEGADGLKTGTSSTAGFCLCATAQRDSKRIISVTMNSSSNEYRFQDSTALLDFGFNALEEKYKEKLCYTNTRTFLNGYEMPTLSYVKNGEAKPVIIAENLNNYGFDVYLDSKTNTLRAVVNPDKRFSPVSCDMYRGTYGVHFANVLQKGSLRLVISDGTNEYEIKDFYASDGCHLMSAEEFGYKFSLFWDDKEASLNIIYPNNFTHTKLKGGLAYISNLNIKK